MVTFEFICMTSPASIFRIGLSNPNFFSPWTCFLTNSAVKGVATIGAS